MLLLFLPLFFIKRYKQPAAIRFSSGALLSDAPQTYKTKLLKSMKFLRIIILSLFIIALARPQKPIIHQRIYKEGIDIALVLDTSTSMRAMDFKINNKRYDRLHVVKKVVVDFVANRVNDRIGMIAFAKDPYVVCPLTLDHNWLRGNLERVQIGMAQDGTAIGSSITAALNRLKNSKAESKIIILLTDGRNNVGKISPLTAAEAAHALGVKIYTIGAGSIGEVPFPVRDVFGRTSYQNVKIDIDESMLAKIAQISNGQYFRATDTESLKGIYAQIDKLEATPFEQPIYMRYEELFVMFLMWGFILLIIEQVLLNTILLKVP